jgi:hypothetical protein
MILEVFAAPFALGGLVCAYQAASSLGPYRQVLRRETRPVRAIEKGPVEVAGTIRAKGETLAAIDGTPAIALRTVVSYAYSSGGRKYHRFGVVNEVVAVEAELVDETGSCVLDTGSLVLIGDVRSHRYEPRDFAAAHPDLWARIDRPALTRITVEQSVVPDGARGLASGEAEPIEDVLEPGEGYRGEHKRRFRLTNTPDRPLIVSAFPEARARRILLRPSWVFAILACVWFGVAATLVAASHVIGG